MTSTIINASYHAILKTNPLRYRLACDFIRSLADFEEHPLEHGSRLFFDVRAVMFFEVNAHWVLTGKGAQVWRDRIHPGNEKSFLESLALLAG